VPGGRSRLVSLARRGHRRLGPTGAPLRAIGGRRHLRARLPALPASRGRDLRGGHQRRITKRGGADVDCELALINGQVVDPVEGAIFDADIAVTGGKIVGISRQRGVFNAARILDVSGACVTPALIDGHVHCFEHVSPGSLNPDRIGVRQGVGVVVDAGSFGPRNAAGFQEYVVKPAATRVYGLVNISRWGNSTNPGESEIIGFLNPTEVVRLIDRSGDWVRGVKVRASVSAVGALGILPVRLAKQAAREAGVPLMVHIGNGPPTLEEVCEVLTAGD